MNNKKRGAFLKKARERKNLTQEELGALIYYSDKTISAWEKGIYTPSDYDTIIRLAEVLDIPPLSIIYGEENTTEEEQIYSYLNYKEQTRLKILIISIVFLITLITILVSFYLTNLKDTTKMYSITTDREDIILKDSFYLSNKRTSVLSLNKILIMNNKYSVKHIELYYLDNNKKIKIVSGPNENYYLENNNLIDEYNIKDLVKKNLYLIIKTNNNEEIKSSVLLNKRHKLFYKEETIQDDKDKKYITLEKMGFIYQDNQYVLQEDNITIRFNKNGILYLTKENKDNNEYLTKRINDKNIIYKKMFINGKYQEKNINIKDKETCNLQSKKDIKDLVKCLNYISEELSD